MRPVRRTHTSPHSNSISHRRCSHNQLSISIPKKKITKLYAIGKCQTYLLLMSLLFNFVLIYLTTVSYVESTPTVSIAPIPICTVISNDPHSLCNPNYIAKLIQSNPQLQYKMNELQNENKNEVQINKVNQLHINTAKSPPYNEMSSIADLNKRELSWISPLSRSIPGDINLYITESEHELWFNNRLFVFEENKVAFCVMEKNSCTMFKQIFKRIRGKHDYLTTDYTKIHYLPYRGLEDISFYDINVLSTFINDEDFYFAAFVREPLERLVSGYIDKCDKKRGVNLCDYARWSPRFKGIYGEWNRGGRTSFTPRFDIWADGLFHCPCWPETDWHFAPQYNFCNLYQYVDKYDIFRFENTTHRKIWMERAGFWDIYGKSGWRSGGNDGVSIVDYAPQSHSSTGDTKGGDKYIEIYRNVDPDILATIIDNYRNDYIIFGIQMPDWMCNTAITINNNVKRALRTLPRTSRPPCDNYKWLWERE